MNVFKLNLKKYNTSTTNVFPKKLVKSDSFGLECDLDTAMINWKIRCEICDDCNSIKLATANSGGSNAQIEITDASKGIFFITVAKDLTTLFLNKGYIEIEVETNDDPTKKYTISKCEIEFEDEQIDWTLPGILPPGWGSAEFLINWSMINNRPDSTVENIDDAVDNKHIQNTDTDLDATFESTFVKKIDNVNVLADIDSTGANIEDAVTKKHSQNTDTKLDEGGANEISASEINTHIDSTANPHSVDKADVGLTNVPNLDTTDAINNEHTQNGDTDLDATFEATFVKKTDIVNVLSDITSTGANIEDAVNKKHSNTLDHTQGTDQKLDDGGVNEVTVANVKDAVDKKHDKQHDLNASADHNGVAGAVENNFVSFDSSGLPKDSNHKSVELDSAKNIIITLCGNAQIYLFTTNLLYTTFNEFCFCGTDKVGTPTNIKIIAHVEKITGEGNVRIYDVTNSKVICEKTGIFNLVSEVIDMGVLSNLPTGEAVLEIQAKNLDGDETRISSLAVKF